jgi:hypothetical protein
VPLHEATGQVQVLQRGGPEDGPGGTGGEHRINCDLGPQPAGHLAGDGGCDGCEDRGDRPGLDGVAGPGTVQVDDVQGPGTSSGERGGDRRGLVAEHIRTRKVALPQPNHLSPDEVDCR